MDSKRDLDSLDKEPFLAKKIKLEHELISEKINKNHPDINIPEHEIDKFLLIFNLLLETSLSKDETEVTDAEDGIQGIILTVGKSLLKLLKGNIESLKLPTPIKKSLKKLKSFLLVIGVNSDGSNKNNSDNGLRPETKGNETAARTSMQAS